jgi:hypothetical protein
VKTVAELVEKLRVLTRRFKDLKFVKVAGHAGVELNERVDELARMANGDLVVAGVFTAPGLPANVRIARWNGVSWSPLATSVNGSTLALLPLPNGELLAGGTFTSIGGANIPYLARWTAGTWQPLGGGVNNTVRALTRLPNGDIVAGGDFTLAGTLTNTALYAARWDGAAWTAMSAPGPVTLYLARPEWNHSRVSRLRSSGNTPSR